MDWPLFITVFAAVFLVELPDKTVFMTIALSSRYPAPAVFIGAATAFALQGLISVLIGSVLLRMVPTNVVHVIAGVLFVILGILIWRQREKADENLVVEAKKTFLQAVVTAFALIFLAEWGDFSQITSATFAAKYPAPFTIYTAAVLAEWSVCGLAITLGYTLKKKLPQKLLKKLAAAVFVGIGVFLLLR